MPENMPKHAPCTKSFSLCSYSFIGKYQHLFVCHLLCPTDFHQSPPMPTFQMLLTAFTARRSYASAVLGVVILSVCLSVCQSVTRVLCDKPKQCTANILIPNATFKPKIVDKRSPFSFSSLPFPYPFHPFLLFRSVLPLSLPAPSPALEAGIGGVIRAKFLKLYIATGEF